MDIVKEVCKLKLDLVKLIDTNPLPIVVKSMIINELLIASREASVNEIKLAAVKEKKEKADENTEKEGS